MACMQVLDGIMDGCMQAVRGWRRVRDEEDCAGIIYRIGPGEREGREGDRGTGRAAGRGARS